MFSDVTMICLFVSACWIWHQTRKIWREEQEQEKK